MDIRVEQPDCVDDSNHLADRNNQKHQTEIYIRQLLPVTFDEMVRLNQERMKRKELDESIYR